ncbi:ABC transporter permease [Thermoleophilum album]|uniref:ABC transporter permease n=1 Tax=Thermoleophilum album TaxID=29539 RepID=UPI00237CF021|nr:ABC transporter permease [Thermoleophilum album]
MLAVYDFKKAYHGTVLGYVWSVMRPLLMFSVLVTVFTQVFRAGSGVPHYPVMLLLNIVLFTFFTEATTMSVTSIVSQESIVRKTEFPRAIIPVSVVLTTTFTLIFNMIVVFAFMLAWGLKPRLTWLGLIPIVIVLFWITACVSLILASLYPRFRDTAIIWSVISTVLFYGSPVLYPAEIVPTPLAHFMQANPLAPVLEMARVWMIDPTAPTPVELAGGAVSLTVSIGFTLLLGFVAVRVFNREAPRIAESL